MRLCSPRTKWGRRRREVGVAGIGLVSALSLTGPSAVLRPPDIAEPVGDQLGNLLWLPEQHTQSDQLVERQLRYPAHGGGQHLGARTRTRQHCVEPRSRSLPVGLRPDDRGMARISGGPSVALTLANQGNFEGSLFVASLSGSEQSSFDPFGYGEPIPDTVDPIPVLSQGLPIAMGGLGLLGIAALMVRRGRRQGRMARADVRAS